MNCLIVKKLRKTLRKELRHIGIRELFLFPTSDSLLLTSEPCVLSTEETFHSKRSWINLQFYIFAA